METELIKNRYMLRADLMSWIKAKSEELSPYEVETLYNDLEYAFDGLRKIVNKLKE